MMTTSPISFLAEIGDMDRKTPIPEGKLAYFRERGKNRLYDFIIGRFVAREKASQLTRADLARRINKKPEQITRWLASPSNWTLDTISDLMLAIYGSELGFSEIPLVEAQRNYDQNARLENYDFPKRPNISTTGQIYRIEVKNA